MVCVDYEGSCQVPHMMQAGGGEMAVLYQPLGASTIAITTAASGVIGDAVRSRTLPPLGDASILVRSRDQKVASSVGQLNERKR
jgi:hypothetical protein